MTPPPVPTTCARRPTRGGIVLPWVNVQLADGGVDFRSAHNARWRSCWERGLCQVCGDPIGLPVVLLGGPGQLVDLMFDEPPLHPECAVYVSRACPMVAGERERYSDTPRVSTGGRGKTCATPGCDCGGWVTATDGTGKEGHPAEDWFAFYVTRYSIAHAPGGEMRGGICFPDDVRAVRHVSAPGTGRTWITVPDALSGYTRPTLSALPSAP